MTHTKATATWTSECPTKADAGDAYYFVRRKDKLDVVVMGFSMGKGWLNGVSYEPSEMRSHLFLGPVTPELFDEAAQLRETRKKATATWAQADANGIYWWRYDASSAPEIVKVRDGEFYSILDPDPTSTSVGEFLGPITPELFNERDALLSEVAQLRQEVEFAVANGHKWTLEDWTNWIENHARALLGKER